MLNASTASRIDDTASVPAARARLVRNCLALALLLSALLLSATSSDAGWLTRLAREGSEAAGRAGRHGVDVPGPGGRAARILHEIPDAKQNALAAHATPEGHWQFVNAEGKTFTVGTPDEMSRVEHALLPDRRPSTDKPVDLYLSKESLFVSIDNFDVLPAAARLHVVIDGKRYPLYNTAASGQPALSVEFRKNVRVPVQNRAGFREAIAYLARPLNQSNIRVLSVREGGVRQLSYTPKRDASGITQVDNVDPKHVREAIATARGKTLLIAGEVDNGVMKFAGGGSPSISLDELRAAARTGDVDLIILHTQAGRQPGGRNWLWQRVGVRGLEEAKKKRVFADFVEALGAERGMYEVTAATESGGRMKLFAQPWHDSRTVVTETSNWVSDAVAKLTGDMVMQAVEVASRNANEQKERDRRIIPFIPSGLQIAYILGLVAGIGGYPTAAAWWQRIWYRAPRPAERSRVLYFLAGLPRFIVFFFLFLPLVGVPAVIVHYTIKAWRFVSAPFRWIAAWRRGAEV